MARIYPRLSRVLKRALVCLLGELLYLFGAEEHGDGEVNLSLKALELEA